MTAGPPLGDSVSGPVVVTVPSLLAGVRTDRAVAMLADVSRSMASTLIGSGRVRLDGATVTSGRVPLPAGASLAISLPAEGSNLPRPDASVPVQVVDEDSALIVVDKPAGMVVHPGAGRLEGTLVHGLLAHAPDLADLVGSGECDPARPGIVHRLDRETSGLLVVARTAPSYRSLVAQFKARTVERRYLALVEGRIEEDRGKVEAPIGRSTRSPTRMVVSASGRPASTAYEVLERFAGPEPATLLALRLGTGRTHQIRVHLAAIGHPVLGDSRYGRPSVRLPDRLFLHAGRLGVVHPATGRRVTWESPLPPELARLVPGGIVEG